MKDHRRPRARPDLLDEAARALVDLIRRRSAESASGDFGIVVNLDRGEHRRIQIYEMRTVLPAKVG